MPWVPFATQPTNRYEERQLHETEGTTRFLLDNNTDAPRLRHYLDGQGIAAAELLPPLRSRPDTEILSEALRLDRVLLTHDPDFLSMDLYPPEANPGVVVMPGGSGDVERFLPLIGRVLLVMRPYRGLWRGVCVDIRPNGIVAIEGVNQNNGEPIERWYMRFNERGDAETWMD